jgi:hypothetical protein
MAVSPTLSQSTAPAYLRLATLPRMRRSAPRPPEVAGELRGRCLDWGVDLPVPLGTERHDRELIVGRGGQGTVEVVAG